MTGKAAPDIVKAVPLIVAELMVNGAVPVEYKVSGSVAEEPSSTVPKLRLVALTVSCGATPSLVRPTVIPKCLTALLLIVSVPVAMRAALGANMT